LQSLPNNTIHMETIAKITVAKKKFAKKKIQKKKAVAPIKVIKNQVKFLPNEEFREVQLHESLKNKYAISNRGRLISFTTNMQKGRLLEGGKVDGYKILRYSIREADKLKYKYKFFYKLVAEAFLPKENEEQTFVLHLDYVRDNDLLRNLKWATREEMIAHSNRSPHVQAAREKFVSEKLGSKAVAKLDSTQVMRIKKLLALPDQKTRKSMIAKQFGITTMQLRRIETGENWGYVTI
jgi:hypothetical protein